MLTTGYTNGPLKVRKVGRSIMLGVACTVTLTEEEAVELVLGVLQYLDDADLARVALMVTAVEGERYPPEYKDEDPDEYTQALIDAEPEVRP